VQDNKNKIKQNKQLPWLVSNVVEILDIEPEQDDEGNVDLD
jgi:26S proteasome regulatory subunit T5